MDQYPEDEGVIEAVLDRITKFTLPKTLAIKARLDRGEKLSDFDIQFLLQVYERSKRTRKYLSRHPEYELLATELLSLYAEIMREGIENENVDEKPRP